MLRGRGVPAAMQRSRCWLTAAATVGLTGGEGHVLALQNRGHWGFGPAPGKRGTSTRHRGLGEPGSVTGDRARSDPRRRFPSCTKGDRASLREGFEFRGRGVFDWMVLFPSGTGDVPLPLAASMTLGASLPPCPALPQHTDHHKPCFFPPRYSVQKHPSAAKAQSNPRLPRGSGSPRQLAAKALR